MVVPEYIKRMRNRIVQRIKRRVKIAYDRITLLFDADLEELLKEEDSNI